jgi:hypothetical protein
MLFYLGGPGNIAHAVLPYVPGVVIQIGVPRCWHSAMFQSSE